jgi:hypothetical protein
MPAGVALTGGGSTICSIEPQERQNFCAGRAGVWQLAQITDRSF